MGLLSKTFQARAFSLAFTVTLLSIPAQAGRIVVNHDEWTASDAGYSSAGHASTHNFVLNLANFLAGPGGNILVYSDVFGLNESLFRASLSAGGFNVTYGKLNADLTGYDAVFLAESLPGSTPELIDFVNSGGGVYIEAGTGYPGSATEAARWNGFLNPFGLVLDPVYNICCGNDPVDSSGHALFNGVEQLFYKDGNTVSATGSNSSASVIEYSNSGNRGLIGVYDAHMPEPSTYILVSVGLLAAYLKRRSASRL